MGAASEADARRGQTAGPQETLGALLLIASSLRAAPVQTGSISGLLWGLWEGFGVAICEFRVELVNVLGNEPCIDLRCELFF